MEKQKFFKLSLVCSIISFLILYGFANTDYGQKRYMNELIFSLFYGLVFISYCVFCVLDQSKSHNKSNVGIILTAIIPVILLVLILFKVITSTIYSVGFIAFLIFYMTMFISFIVSRFYKEY